MILGGPFFVFCAKVGCRDAGSVGSAPRLARGVCGDRDPFDKLRAGSSFCLKSGSVQDDDLLGIRRRVKIPTSPNPGEKWAPDLGQASAKIAHGGEPAYGVILNTVPQPLPPLWVVP